MKIRYLLSGLFVISLGLPAVLNAQPIPAVNQFDRTQRELQMQKPIALNLSTNVAAPEIYTGENTDVGPQRILRLTPRKTYFSLIADSQYFYSDNVYLSDGTKQDSTLFVNTIQFAFAPEAYKMGSGLFSPAFGFRSQWFNYGLGYDHTDTTQIGTNTVTSSIDRLDFNAQTFFINGRYQLNTWQFNAGFDFTRLLDQDKYEEAYREYVPTMGLQKFFPVNDYLIFNAGVQTSYHLTETTQLPPFQRSDVNDRFDGVFNVSMSYQIGPHFVVQPSYRFQYTYYPHFTDNIIPWTERTDIIHSMGLSATYYFTRNISARIFANYEIKNSDYSHTPSELSYHKFDAGAGAGLNIRF
jgi:predicted porin